MLSKETSPILHHHYEDEKTTTFFVDLQPPEGIMVKTTIQDLILSGCDERITLAGANFTNRYFLNPFDFDGLLHRGSCTANTLNDNTNKLLHETNLRELDENFEEVVSGHANRIKQLLKTDGGCPFEVFFAPSGSDLAYYPILFKQMLSETSEVVNIVTCPEELGSGTRLASSGKFHAALNQFNEEVQKENPIAGLPEIQLFEFSGRDSNGHILNNHEAITSSISELGDKEIVVNLVYGSKSGIEDNLKILEHISGKNILCTVDLCQFRNSKLLVQYLLAKGCLIYLTGSKFYQAPPFCGCVLVPEELCLELEESDAQPVANFKSIFSRFDIPERFAAIRNQLPDFKNTGLHLRWKCALYEMEEFDGISDAATLELIADWNEMVTQRLSKSDFFELMPDMKITNQSIISFKVKKGRDFWDYDQLWKLFEKLVTSDYDSENFRKVFVGQPVRYESGSFLRLALGARNVLNLLALPEQERFQSDLELIQTIEKEIACA